MVDFKRYDTAFKCCKFAVVCQYPVLGCSFIRLLAVGCSIFRLGNGLVTEREVEDPKVYPPVYTSDMHEDAK
jgi:hypothetical protein